VWDVQNNSSTTTTDFIVSKNADLALNMVLNYPNPFTTRTSFFFEHNRNCEDLHVTIQIFTISGKIAKTIRTTINCEGFRNDGIVWDGRDDYGDKLGKGVYLYKIAVTDKDQKKAEKIEKLVILN
jgi:flagellar hook assembly protein FlgD